MKKEQNKNQSREIAPKNRVAYLAPIIEVVEIELEQTLFAGSGDLPGLGGEDW